MSIIYAKFRWVRKWAKKYDLDILWPVPLFLIVTLLGLYFYDASWPVSPITTAPQAPPAGTRLITGTLALSPTQQITSTVLLSPGPPTVGDVTALLIIPAGLAVVAYVFSVYQRREDREIAKKQREQDRQIADERREQDRQIAETERQTERDIARERNEDTELQNYFDRMSELMTHGLQSRPILYDHMSNVIRSQPGQDENYETARAIARTRTLTVLRSIKNPVRNNSLIQFLSESNLIDAKRPVIDLREADLREVNLQGANLQKINLRGADLQKADLSGADLSGAGMGGANLGGAILHNTNLGGAVLDGANLGEANLGGAFLGGAFLGGANLREASLYWAYLKDAYLKDANLSVTNLSVTNLSGADLSGADLFGANLRRANLRRADLRSANLEEANCTDVKYDGNTIWPDGTNTPPDYVLNAQTKPDDEV